MTPHQVRHIQVVTVHIFVIYRFQCEILTKPPTHSGKETLWLGSIESNVLGLRHWYAYFANLPKRHCEISLTKTIIILNDRVYSFAISKRHKWPTRQRSYRRNAISL
jgi:hypothetical protein